MLARSASPELRVPSRETLFRAPAPGSALRPFGITTSLWTIGSGSALMAFGIEVL
jgi:hypothetical protein